MKIAVAGGTGLVGRLVVREADSRGHDVLVLARSTGTNLMTGEGLANRLVDVDAVIDVTNTRTQRRQRAQDFFATSTTHLLDAERQAGVQHHLLLSIVGIDRVPTGYYRAKLLQEELTSAAHVPWSILRAGQFHEFAKQALGFLQLGPISLVPTMTIQPLAATEVAVALVDQLEDGAGGRVADLAGPEVHQLVDLATRVNRAQNLGRAVIGVPMPGAGGRAMRAGNLISQEAGPRGLQTFDEWLAAQPAPIRAGNLPSAE